MPYRLTIHALPSPKSTTLMHTKEISVVIPCFNEGKNIQQNINKIHRYLQSRFENFEIIAVNDGSRDNTLSELHLIQQAVPLKILTTAHNAGKGKAVRDGISTSKFSAVIYLDADLAIPVEELDDFLLEIESGADMVIASRFVPGIKIIEPVLWYRQVMEKVFRMLRKIILNNWKIQDTQCGFKLFRKDAAQRIFSIATINRFAFDSEIIFIANKLGYTISELPVTLQNPTNSSVRIILDPINMFFALIKIRYNDLRGRYG